MRKTIALLLCTAMMLCLVPAALAEDTVITVVAWDVATTPYYAAYKDAFEAANPGVKVEYIDIAAQDYDQNKAGIMLAGGDKSDVFFIKQLDDATKWYSQGYLASLNDYIAADSVDLSAYAGMADCYAASDGQQVALPFRADYWVLFYNKDLFDAAGVAYPTNDMTWDEYKDLAIKLTSGTEGVDKIYGAHYHTWLSDVANWAVCDGVNTLADGDYSDLAYFYQLALDLEDAGAVRAYTDLKASGLHYRGAFAAGDIAMLLMGYWELGNLVTDTADGTMSFNYGFVSVPHAEDVPAGSSFGSPTGMSLNQASENKDAAWKFISFVTGEEGAKALIPTGNRPAYINESVAEVMASVDGFPTDEASKAALLPTAVYLEWPVGDNVPAIKTIVNEEHTL
ncbi:MAG: sugar ABC transporter substrate-binding protein, partial [Oscillospiraceae bacterium]|nr:sugar ABC transporter substrate-binding protein [Oscillospiraceae bacterium]